MKNQILLFLLLLIATLLTACTPEPKHQPTLDISIQPTIISAPQIPTPLPVRPHYAPGELVEYYAQSGDSLPALANHFNTTEKEIREANPILPGDVTTLPPGMPMRIPIYYEPLWGSTFHILPDSHFINGPAQKDFDTITFVRSQKGWLKDLIDYPQGTRMIGGEIIENIAINFSISPRLLLAILEYQTGALSQSTLPGYNSDNLLGLKDREHPLFRQQLILAANILNNGYYGWRTGRLRSFEHPDGRLEQPDPWQNAATVALQYYFSRTMSRTAYEQAIGEEGFIHTYITLFGDPWENDEPHIPGSLRQPPLLFPFEVDSSWTYTGGPHTGWGDGDPWAAVDFAPPGVSGCNPSSDVVIAMANGIIARSNNASIALDLDGDGDERTGWVIFYLHLANKSLIPVKAIVNAGEAVGYPSCEGGSSTGTHVHVARKYNGEWIPAAGPLAYNFEGWTVQNGNKKYEGTLTRYGNVIRACVCSDAKSRVLSSSRYVP